MQKEYLKFKDALCFEGMTSIRAIIKGIDSGINDRQISTILFDKDKMDKNAKTIGYLKAESNKYGFELEQTSSDVLEEITLGNSHGGIDAICKERTIPCLSHDLFNAEIKKNGFYAMIQGIEDPYNFGYSVRSIYAAGGSGIILSPRNWMGVAGVVARSSAGSSELIAMFVSEPEEAVDLFKSLGYKIICAGIRDSESIFDTDLQKPLFVVLGGEKRGISRAILDKADTIVRIDYGNDFNGSLSTAAASAVFAFEIFRANR